MAAPPPEPTVALVLHHNEEALAEVRRPRQHASDCGPNSSVAREAGTTGGQPTPTIRPYQ